MIMSLSLLQNEQKNEPDKIDVAQFNKHRSDVVFLLEIEYHAS